MHKATLSSNNNFIDSSMENTQIIPFKDKTFCASPQCENKCGRKMTISEKEQLDKMNENMWVGVMQGYFCGEPEDE